MPMDFPDFNSLKSAATIHKFRQPLKNETEDQFRTALANHVQPIDMIESMEIRNKVGWDRFTAAQNNQMLLTAFLRNK